MHTALKFIAACLFCSIPLPYFFDNYDSYHPIGSSLIIAGLGLGFFGLIVYPFLAIAQRATGEEGPAIKTYKKPNPWTEAIGHYAPWLFVSGGFLLSALLNDSSFVGGGIIVALVIALLRRGERAAEAQFDYYADRFWSRRR